MVALTPARAVFLAALLAAPARAAGGFPGPVDPEVVGQWSCGDTQIAITADGSIDLAGEEARAGVIRAESGKLEIAWDGGALSDWAYAAGDGALILATDRGANYACLILR